MSTKCEKLVDELTVQVMSGFKGAFATGVACDMSKNASRITKFTRGPSVFHTTMKNKQVEFNP